MNFALINPELPNKNLTGGNVRYWSRQKGGAARERGEGTGCSLDL